MTFMIWGVSTVMTVRAALQAHGKRAVLFARIINNRQGDKELAKLTEIEGIGEAYAAKLAEAGVASLESLLNACCQKSGRKETAEKTGISEKLLLSWANRADLARIKGVSTQYADLLECAGVDTVPELAQRNAENLHAKMVEVNEQKNLVRKVAALSQVQDWVAQAKDLPRVITH